MHIAKEMNGHTELERGRLQAKLLGQGVPCAPKQFAPSAVAQSKFLRPRQVGVVVAFLVGTGGLLTPSYVAARDDRGYRLQDFGYESPQTKDGAAKPKPRTPEETLARVREVFTPTVTDLATLFGVSRQAIYNWQSGQHISGENEARLEQLGLAADLLDAAGLAGKPNAFRRKLRGGKTLFEAVRSGENAEAAAEQLIALMEREASQRAALSKRLANRSRKPYDVDEIGSPYLDERG